jgi:plastocyanin
MSLSSPLEAKVRSNGRSAAGVRVFWRTQFGEMQPEVSITDDFGIARSAWILGADTGPVTASATLTDASPLAVATFRTTAYEQVAVHIDSASDRQFAVVGNTLPRRLRVLVRNAAGPRPGVAVHWSASAGSIGSRSISDADGYAETEWQMPTVAALHHSAYAFVPGFAGRVVGFAARSVPGPVARLLIERDHERSVPANAFSAAPLIVSALDAFSNRVSGVPIRWQVVTGPVKLTTGEVTVTDAFGRTSALISPQGIEGSATVRAFAGDASANFSLLLSPRVVRVTLDTETQGGWVSNQNGGRPAQDTIAVGETMVFGLSMFDYDNHNVISVGEPAFDGGGEFPYANPSEVRITFTTPGFYRYQDSYTGSIGSVLVRRRSVP